MIDILAQLQVPAVAWWPGKISPGSVNENFTSSLDLFVTFLSLAEVPVPTGVLLDGKDISHIFDNTVDISQVEKSALSADNYTFFYYRGPQLMAARQGPLKAHFITHSGFGSEPPVTHNPPLIFNVEVQQTELIFYQIACNYISSQALISSIEYNVEQNIAGGKWFSSFFFFFFLPFKLSTGNGTII